MDKIINIGPATIFCRDIGSGPAVVLLHGFAEDGATWDNMAAPLSAHCRLIIPDLPGSGRSSALPGSEPDQSTGSTIPALPDHNAAAENFVGPASPRPELRQGFVPPLPSLVPFGSSGTSVPSGYIGRSRVLSIDDLAAAIRSLLDHLGIDKCIMIGHSMGGYITLAFAEKYPDRLTALGLFHSTAYPDSEEKKAVRRKSIEFIRKNGAELFIRQSTPGLFGQYTHQHNPRLIDEMTDRYIGFPPATLIASYQAMITRPDRTHVLREFHGPVLFIIGEEDTIVPLQSALEQSHLPAVSHIHLVKNTGHEGMHEAPGPCSDILHDFINFVQHA